MVDEADVGLLVGVLVDCVETTDGTAETGLSVGVGLPIMATLSRLRAGSARSPDAIL